jgi:hypothetical protein
VFQRFNFEWKYIKGTDNTVADPLSRLYEPLNAVTLKSAVLIRVVEARKVPTDLDPQTSPTIRKRTRRHQQHTLPSGPHGHIDRVERVPRATNDAVPQQHAESDHSRSDLANVAEHMLDGYRRDPWFDDPANTDHSLKGRDSGGMDPVLWYPTTFPDSKKTS